MLAETYLDRIKKLKTEKKITNEKLSEMTGIPLGTLSKLLAGINDSPKLVNMVAIAEALGCSLDYLVTGQPENTHNYTLAEEEISLIEAFRMLDEYGRSLLVTVVEKERDRAARQAAEQALLLRDLTGSGSVGRSRRRGTTGGDAAFASAKSEDARYRTVSALTLTPARDNHTSAPVALATKNESGVVLGGIKERSVRMEIPLYDLPVSAGVGEFLSESSGVTISVPVGDRTPKDGYALRISGNSMEPKYKSGDILLVEKCASVNEGELGIFILDGSGYFKQYGGDRLLSLNPDYQPILLKNYDRVECCGRVVSKLKRK